MRVASLSLGARELGYTSLAREISVTPAGGITGVPNVMQCLDFKAKMYITWIKNGLTERNDSRKSKKGG